MITPVQPSVNITGKYNCTETAKALGIHRNTLAGFTNKRLIHSKFSVMTGRRYYLGSEIIRFWNAYTR